METKRCAKCLKTKPLCDFSVSQGYPRARCKKCRSDDQREWYNKDKKAACEVVKRYQNKNREAVRERIRKIYARDPDKARAMVRASYRRTAEKHPEKLMLRGAKVRAVRKGIEFNLKTSDIVIPDTCPVLGIPLIRSNGNPTSNSPSLDRIDLNKGYTAENVAVISQRANTLKSDATIQELELVLNYMKKHLDNGFVEGTASGNGAADKPASVRNNTGNVRRRQPRRGGLGLSSRSPRRAHVFIRGNS